MSRKDKINFMKLSHKAFLNMTKQSGFPNDVIKLAKRAKIESNRGYDFFLKWFTELAPEDKEVLAAEIQHFTRQKKDTIEKMLNFKFEELDVNEGKKNFKEITEAPDKGVTFTLGRFNPPTVGHMKLAAKMKSVSGSDPVMIFTTHTTDKKKNPLTNAQIRKFMNPMLPRGINVMASTARTVFEVVVDLYNKGYRKVKMVVGSDRIKEF